MFDVDGQLMQARPSYGCSLTARCIQTFICHLCVELVVDQPLIHRDSGHKVAFIRHRLEGLK